MARTNIFKMARDGNVGDITTGRITSPTAVAVAPGAGTAGTDTILKSSVVKNGGIITTSILIDLTGLASSTTDLDIIGTGTAAAFITRIDPAINGTLLGGRVTCLETPAGGIADIDIYSATEATGVFDGAVGDLVEVAMLTRGGNWAAGDVKGLTGVPVAGKYVYLTGGAAGTAAAYTAGVLLIELFGA